MNIILIKLLPSVRLDRLSQLPNKPGIYYATRGCKILYIGLSTNLNARWNSKNYGRHHRHDEILQHGGTRLHYRIEPKHRIEYIEALEIRRHRPPLNRVSPKAIRPTPSIPRIAGAILCLATAYLMSSVVVWGVAAVVAIGLLR